jgi:hypothetical protein
MTQRRLFSLRYKAAFLGLASVLAAPVAQAQQTAIPRDDQVTYSPPVTPSASVLEVARPQVVEYEAGPEQAGLIDPRAKAAWLTECRRRANLSGVSLSKDRRDKPGSAADEAKAALSDGTVYDYCEAYLDDYYRNYAQSAAGNSYTYQSQGLPQPAQLSRDAAAQQAQLPYEEIITEEYVPVRTRSIAKRNGARPLRDKRVRLYPR